MKTQSYRRIGFVCSLVGWIVLASGGVAMAVSFAGGTGEPNDPYQIATAEQLIGVGQDPNLLSRHFVLVSDIDLDPNLPGGRIFDDALIAPDDNNDDSTHGGQDFTGTFDGQGHVVRNLWISGRSGCDAGLFGKSRGFIKDLHLRDVHVSGSTCGALAGLNIHGVILHCSVTGQVSGSGDVGGLIGLNWDSIVMACESQARVSGKNAVGALAGMSLGGTFMRCETQADVNGVSYVGGLVGQIHSETQVIESRVRGTVAGGDNVGGLVGSAWDGLIVRCAVDCNITAQGTAGGLVGDSLWFSELFVIDCYSQGAVTGSVIGGLIGNAGNVRMMNCYAACKMIPWSSQTASPAVGGIFGQVDKILPSLYDPLVMGCLWDTELSGVEVGTGSGEFSYGIGLSTILMQTAMTFLDLGWDFVGAWEICEGASYPRLSWEGIECVEVR